jgi:acyl carrier protein
LARHFDVAAQLERITGIVPMRADEALSHLDILLARPSLCPPTVYCATFRPGAALQGLKLLETPAFVRLFAEAEGSDQEVGIDLAMQVAGKSEVKARAIVARLVASEVARSLRLSAEEIDVARPLDELGMDSLMSLELRMSIERRFGIELPIVAISSGVNVNDLATRLLAGLGAAEAAASAGEAEMRLIMQHGSSDVGLSQLMAVTDEIDAGPGTAALL